MQSDVLELFSNLEAIANLYLWLGVEQELLGPNMSGISPYGTCV